MNLTTHHDWPEGAVIEPGERADFDALAHFHYRAGRPATIAGLLRARIEGELAGVLVVSMPARNASWRAMAWPGAFDAPDQREALARLNREVRCITRVIVEPRFRGLGLAAALVRAYLHAPLSGRTEAVAAMGSFSRFFARAGMTAIPLNLPPGDERFLESLRASGRSHADLMTAEGRARVIEREELVRELRAWVRSRSVLRTRSQLAPHDLALLAAERILPRRIAYVSGPPPLGEPPCRARGTRSEPLAPARRAKQPRAPARVPLVVMLSPAERRACTRALGRRHTDRRQALLSALGLGALGE